MTHLAKALDIIGCADDIISQGGKTTGLEIGTRSSALIYPDPSYLKGYTNHPYAILIPQSLTEHVLVTKLSSFGVQIQRPLRVVGMNRNTGDALLTDVVFEDGRVVSAKYVIGADGARSVVSPRLTYWMSYGFPFGLGSYQRWHRLYRSDE